MNATKVITENLIVVRNFEKFTSINYNSDQSQSGERGGLSLVTLVVYKGEFLRVTGQQPNFQERLCLHSVFTSVKFQQIFLLLLSAKFLLFMNSI